MKRALLTTALFALLLMCGGVAKGQNDTLPDIMIGGIAITESNDSIVGDCISGHVSYDALTKIMTLDDATISENVSFWRNSHIKIKLLGNNFIQNLFIGPDSCTIIGPGHLQVGTATEGTAIDAARTSFLGLMGGATLSITAMNKGINTLYDYIGDDNPIYPLFAIDNSTLTITAPTCFFLIPYWSLNNCHIVSPTGVVYDSYHHWLTQDGNMVMSMHDYMEIRQGMVNISEEVKPKWRAIGMDGGIRIDGLTQNQTVEVLNIAGQCVYVGKPQMSGTFISLKSGIYIVRVGKETVKTIVQ